MTRKTLIRYLVERRRSAERSLGNRFLHNRERARGKVELINDLLNVLEVRRVTAKALNEE